MKIKAKFIGFFTLGLILFLLYISLMVILLLEVVLPWTGIEENALVFIIVIITAFLSGGVLFSIWFVQPIVSMMSRIRELSVGNYSQPDIKQYWLYKELITDLDSLAVQLKQAENERLKLEQAKQDWVRGISHDIKTPLSYIVGYSSLLLSTDHSWEPEEQQNFLSQIHEKGKYIENLIGNMNLSFRLEDATKPVPIHMTSFDLIAFMEKLVADTLNQQAKTQYALSIQAVDAYMNIQADEQLLYRAFTNLINNAIRHNPVGTEIIVEVKRNEHGGVTVAVRDNGDGMSQEKIDLLFGNYNSGSIAADGKTDYISGLGLSIVKSIVDAHHGKIIVESTVGVGTVFIVHLPLNM